MNYFEYMARKTGAVPTEAPKARRKETRDEYPFHRDLALEVQIEAAVLQARVGRVLV